MRTTIPKRQCAGTTSQNGFSSYSRIAQYEAERKSRPNVEANDWFLLRQCKYIGHSWSGREPAVCNYGIPG
ncbi:hypothetical protein LTS06_011801, partial [Exophiala xenobiotica]